METVDYKKLAENMEVISAVLKKTSCDIAEISNMFIWIGLIFLLKQVCSAVLVNIISPVSADEISRVAAIDCVTSAVCFLGGIIVFLFYLIKCWKKKNRNSIYLMEIWGILLFVLLPVLIFLYRYVNRRISFGIRAESDLLMLHDISFSADIVNVLFYPQILVDCIGSLIILLGIYMVGTFAHNKRLKITIFLLMLLQTALSLLSVFSPEFKINLLTLSSCCSTFCHTFGLILGGLMLKADKRRILDGAE